MSKGKQYGSKSLKYCFSAISCGGSCTLRGSVMRLEQNTHKAAVLAAGLEDPSGGGGLPTKYNEGKDGK